MRMTPQRHDRQKRNPMTTEDQSTGGAQDGSLHLGPRSIPPPEGASDVLRKAVIASALADPQPVVPIPQTVDEWLAFVAAAQEPTIAFARLLEQDLPAAVEHDQIAGVDVYHVIPDEISPAHEDHLFVHVHGGAYMLGGGPACFAEALVLATGIGIRAVSIDYRMAPLHPYPAPVDDVVAVYVELLQRHRPRSMVMGGSSAGGGLTLSAVQRLLEDGIRVPGALFIGTPGSDLTGSGDSVHINHDVDRNIPEWAGIVAAMCECHAAGIDMADPRISPLYGEFDGFPPALLASGVRDIFLSNTVRTHTKLLQAATEAELLVFEGMSHGDYFNLFSSPETALLLTRLDQFCTRHLQGSTRKRSGAETQLESFRWA
jgi:monoterpene epsilon-lactone hydrolase